MIREIVQYPHAILMNRCVEVKPDEFGTVALTDLCSDLRETLETFKTGVGLAANQIGVNKRLFYVQGIGMIVNPCITEFRGQRVPLVEGCLSVKDIKGHAFRHNKINVEYYDPRGAFLIETLSGFQARVFQHELDHLNGIMFTSKIDIVSQQKYVTEIEELKRAEALIREKAYGKA